MHCKQKLQDYKNKRNGIFFEPFQNKIIPEDIDKNITMIREKYEKIENIS